MLSKEVISITSEKDVDFETGLLAKIPRCLTVAMSRDIKKVSTEKFPKILDANGYSDLTMDPNKISSK